MGKGFPREWGVGVKLGNRIGPVDVNINLYCGAFYVLPFRKVAWISGLSIERVTAANAQRSLYPTATQLPGPYNSGPFTRLTDVIIWLSNHLTRRAEVSDAIQCVRLWSKLASEQPAKTQFKWHVRKKHLPQKMWHVERIESPAKIHKLLSGGISAARYKQSLNKRL